MFPIITRRIVFIIALLLSSTIECSASKLRGFPKRNAARALAKGEDKDAITSEAVITPAEDQQIEENNEEEELSSIDPVVESTGKGAAAASDPVVTPVEEPVVEENNEEEELSSIDPMETTGKDAAASEEAITPVEELLYVAETNEEIAVENDEEEEELSSIDPVVDSKGKEKAGKETVIKSVSDSEDEEKLVFDGKAAKGMNTKLSNLQNQTNTVGKMSGPENKVVEQEVVKEEVITDVPEEFKSYDDPEELEALGIRFDDPEVPAAAVSAPTTEVTTDPPAEETRTDTSTESLSLPSDEIQVLHDGAGTNPMFGGEMVEPPRSFGGGADYPLNEEMVPVEVVLEEEREASQNEGHQQLKDEVEELNKGGIFAIVVFGCFVFFLLAYWGKIGPQKQYDSGSDDGVHQANNQRKTFSRASSIPYEDSQDCQAYPHTSYMPDAYMQDYDEAEDKEGSGDPWSYDSPVPNISTPSDQYVRYPVGTRISSILDGTASPSKRKTSIFSDAVRRGYEEFDQSSIHSAGNFFEDVDEDPMRTSYETSRDWSNDDVEAHLAQGRHRKLTITEKSTNFLEEISYDSTVDPGLPQPCHRL